ncbi:unnamed protein product, partial [Symbiodinium sp. CCMP2456]
MKVLPDTTWARKSPFSWINWSPNFMPRPLQLPIFRKKDTLSLQRCVMMCTLSSTMKTSCVLAEFKHSPIGEPSEKAIRCKKYVGWTTFRSLREEYLMWFNSLAGPDTTVPDTTPACVTTFRKVVKSWKKYIGFRKESQHARWEQYAPGPVREVVIKSNHKHSNDEHGRDAEASHKPDKRTATGTAAQPKAKKQKKPQGTEVKPAPPTAGNDLPEVPLPPDDSGNMLGPTGAESSMPPGPVPEPAAPENPQAAAAPAAEDGAPAEVWDPS